MWRWFDAQKQIIIPQFAEILIAFFAISYIDLTLNKKGKNGARFKAWLLKVYSIIKNDFKFFFLENVKRQKMMVFVWIKWNLMEITTLDSRERKKLNKSKIIYRHTYEKTVASSYEYVCRWKFVPWILIIRSFLAVG